MPKSKPVVLLVEDDEFLSELYATKLNLEGFTVLSAADGKKGLKLAQEKHPDVVLLDIILPKLDGFEVLSALKSDLATNAIPVILLTNLSQKDEVKRGLGLGAADYLIKAHFMPSEVLKKIKALVQP